MWAILGRLIRHEDVNMLYLLDFLLKKRVEKLLKPEKYKLACNR